LFFGRRKLKPGERKQELVRLIDEQRSKNIDEMYNLVRLLLPKFDSDRQTYGLKEATIPKVASLSPHVDTDCLDSRCIVVDFEKNCATDIVMCAALHRGSINQECMSLNICQTASIKAAHLCRYVI
jgi:hypothetical protein